ncbi:MAG TPA: hypothetical protein VD970_19960 [Acetobacteraceae bacterium]|nr:hypothetical protein [Acetobacteraceae bacterium]
MPMTLASWFRAAGYGQVTNVTNIFFTKDKEDFSTAGAWVRNKHCVSLLINADLINTGAKGGFFTIPNHWIRLEAYSGIRRNTNNKDAFFATIWSWATRYGLQSVPVDVVISNFFGYVAAVRPIRRG